MSEKLVIEYYCMYGNFFHPQKPNLFSKDHVQYLEESYKHPPAEASVALRASPANASAASRVAALNQPGTVRLPCHHRPRGTGLAEAVVLAGLLRGEVVP